MNSNPNQRHGLAISFGRLLCAGSLLLVQVAVYMLAQFIVKRFGLATYDLALPIDAVIPLIPQFLIVYLGCFIHWFFTLYIIAGDRAHFKRFAWAALLGDLICFIIFIAFPTSNARPDLSGTGAWGWMLGLIYSVDAPLNLFPSMHCFMAWLCFVETRNASSISRWFRILSAVMALLVCIATVALKQHFVVDMFPGIFLAEVCHLIIHKAAGRPRFS